jgi:6-pyruvoyltetrahydropterin/6-carboxytetrahydropterin synthase
MILKVESVFSCAHFYSQPLWSEKRNVETFGRCHTPYGHGHNYRLEVEFYVSREGVFKEKKYYQAIINELTEKIDHEHLNFSVPEFINKNPTTENITIYFFEKLKFIIDQKKIATLRVFEMDSLWVELVQ